jgi:RHS repeat-associated protein
VNGTENQWKYQGKEHQQELGLDWYDFHARNYDPAIGRLFNVDPLADKNHFDSPYAFVHNNPMIYVDPDGKDAILIVFPDYKISTPVGKVGGLGHAGVLLIDNKTGVTKYYEYGRYDSENKGIVRKVTISNVVIGKDGKPTTESLNKVLGQISKKSGQGGKIDGAYIVSDEFDKMNDYAKSKLKENSDPDREEYSLSSNNCGTFAADCVNQDENVDAPWIVNPTPTNIVDEYQEEGNAKVTYDPKNKTTTIGKGNEDDAKKKKKED